MNYAPNLNTALMVNSLSVGLYNVNVWFNFIFGLNFLFFSFLFFLGMVICDNDFETKESKI